LILIASAILQFERDRGKIILPVSPLSVAEAILLDREKPANTT
jgi:hypothetical protein